MLFTELVTNKFAELLGAKYAVFLNDAFQKDFTSLQAHGIDIKDGAFEQYDGIAVAVFSATPVEIINAEKRIFQAVYRLQFWVPLDTAQVAKDGTKVAGFDFYTDIENLLDVVNSNGIELTDEKGTYKAYFTMSEPSLASPAVDETGSYTRGIYEVSGNISIGDIAMLTGADMAVSFVIGGVETFIDEMSNIAISSDTASNLIVETATLKQKQEPAIIGHNVSFAIMDKVSINAARVLIQKKAFENIEQLSSTATTEKRKRQVLTRLYKGGTKRLEFWGNLSVTYSASGKTGFARYDVTIVNSQGD